MQQRMPTGHLLVKIEALVMPVMLAKTRPQAIGQERNLYADVFTVGPLVEKLN